MGLMFKEALDFDEAVKWLDKARLAAPTESVILSNLAAALARKGDVPLCVKYVKEAIELRGGVDEGLLLAGLTTFISPYNRTSEDAFGYRRRGSQLYVRAAFFYVLALSCDTCSWTR
eukprot:m.257153 g.257153  ORF g.257153 m.257153 type:complete len:117 (+) comp17580_c0_seq13:1002-1352(+)